jgi:putative PEP-CTERM system histidine kinase
MIALAAAGYALAGLLFGVLTVLLLTSWRGRMKGVYLVLASGGSVAWAALMAWQIVHDELPTALLWAAEPARQMLWLLFLLQVLTQFADSSPAYGRALRVARLSLSSLALVLMLPFEAGPWLESAASDLAQRSDLRLIGQLLLSVAGMALVEQVLRNTPAERRWGVKHLCIGLGGLFVFDFYLYTDALLFRRVDEAIWLARGAVNAMIVPLLAVSAARNPDWSLPLAVSRRAVFHTTAFFSAGVYMLLMALAGYYIKLYGGEWGRVLQTVFFFGAGIVLVALLLSGQFRARVRVFLSKHFFSYRYDYREEWLRLIGALSGRQSDRPLYERVIWAIGEIVESPAGLLWLCDERGACRLVASLNQPERALPPLQGDHPLARFLEERHWVVNLHEHAANPELYGALQLPEWVGQLDGPWLIVPLIHEDRLRGFVVLMEPRAPQTLNWENLDLLKTAGLQAASYLALHQAADALAEARQFEGFNRLSAFVMHDLKNLIAQLSLVTSNAQRHKQNPAFIDDAMRTIENSVAKMTRLMAQMKSATAAPGLDLVDLEDLVRGVVSAHQRQKPAPGLASDGTAPPVRVRANPDRLAAVIGHVVQNAQDATPASGAVDVSLRVRDSQAIVAVRDTGAGMDEAFVRDRLFRPFDSTKGLTGMGIGAYECRELIRSLGGHVEVESTPGRGTTFTIVLPLAESPGDSVAA